MQQLRTALRTLYYAPSSEERRDADVWLRGFTSQGGSWQLLVSLLSEPDAAVHERFFAAVSLRHSCQRQQSIVEPAALATLAPLLSQQLAAAAVTGCQHTSNQLAAALATIAVRSPALPESQVLPQVLALAHEALLGQRDHGQPQLVLLCLQTALAEAACSREISVHPQRRDAVRAALAAAPQPLEAVQQALVHSGSTLAVQAAAMQLLQAWCSLGQPPAAIESSPALWQQLHQAVLHSELGSVAAEALAALYGTCLDDGRRSSSSSISSTSVHSAQLVQRRIQLLLTLFALLPGFVAALEQALGQAHQAQHQTQLLFAALTVLGAASRAADGQAGSMPVAAAAAGVVQLAADVALLALQQPQLEVILAALQLLDEQLERWKGSNSNTGAGTTVSSLGQQQALLGRLCGSLLQRMALPAGLPHSACTADARDLPDLVQQVRREVADTFRAAADCLGPQQMRRQLLQLASEARAAGAVLQQECCLYALNLIWGRQRSQQQQQQQEAEDVRQAASAVAAALHSAAPKLAGTALTLLGSMAEQLPLLLQEQAQPRGLRVQQQGDTLLPRLLELLLQLVKLPGNDKLSRNAATCCYRLTGERQLAAALAAQHSGWCEVLCGCFVAMGGMQQRAQGGEDLTSAQFLLVSICRLAAAAAEESPQLQQSSALLEQLLSQPAAAADAALAAAAAAPPDSEQQRQQLEQAAVQVETIAVALEAVVGSCVRASRGQGSGIVTQLPSLLDSFGGVLRRAATTASAPAPQQALGMSQQQTQVLLLQAVCRVAAAVAATPAAGLGLDLLQPCVDAPQHPCILLALAQLAASSPSGSSSGSSSSVSWRQLQAAARSSLQAAAAQRSSDPEWQPAILVLGEGCLQSLPSSSACTATLDALLTTVQHSMRSYNREPCEQVVQFAEALCCVGCQQRQQWHKASNVGTALHAPAAASHMAAAAYQQLRQCLDVGLGAWLVLGLLLAAAGAMPPYMMMLIADALHRTWQVVGTNRFGAWLREAVWGAPKGEAPWQRWKWEAQVAAVNELLSAECAQDARRFKRLLKVFCGGKKKGQHIDQLARA